MLPPAVHDIQMYDMREVDTHTQLSQFQVLAQDMAQIDKTELHLHLGGSWPIDYLEKIADPVLFNQLSKLLDQIQSGINYHEAFRVFELTSKIVNTDQKVEAGVVALCKSLADDRVTYAEIRTGLKDLGSGLEGYLNAILRGVQRGCAQNQIKVVVVLSLRRDTSAEVAQQTIDLIKKYRHHGVIGLDLSGDSTHGDGKNIVNAIVQAQIHNIPITLHIGESPKETAEQQIKELQTIKPQRIGHGVHLYPEALQFIQDHKIPVELCLTSAVKVGMISHANLHPGLVLLKQNHPVVVCTDDPLIFRTTLSEECAKVAQINKLSKNDMIKLQQQTINYRLFSGPPMSLKDAKKQFAHHPDKLANAQDDIRMYYEAKDQESAYEKEVKAICQKALVEHFQTHKVTEKSAIIFDIDETALSDYSFFKEQNFEWEVEDAYQFRFKKICTPIRPVRDFYNELKKLGYKLIFLTARRDTLYQATIENLANTGYVYDELILLPITLFEQHVSHPAWKLQIRQELSKKYDIVGSIGDSFGDFEGGCCGVIVKLPNYLY